MANPKKAMDTCTGNDLPATRTHSRRVMQYMEQLSVLKEPFPATWSSSSGVAYPANRISRRRGELYTRWRNFAITP